MPLLRRNADRAIGGKREDRRHHRWPLHELRHGSPDPALDLQALIRWVAGAPLSMKAARGAATMAAPLIHSKQSLDGLGLLLRRAVEDTHRGLLGQLLLRIGRQNLRALIFVHREITSFMITRPLYEIAQSWPRNSSIRLI